MTKCQVSFECESLQLGIIADLQAEGFFPLVQDLSLEDRTPKEDKWDLFEYFLKNRGDGSKLKVLNLILDRESEGVTSSRGAAILGKGTHWFNGALAGIKKNQRIAGYALGDILMAKKILWEGNKITLYFPGPILLANKTKL